MAIDTTNYFNIVEIINELIGDFKLFGIIVILLLIIFGVKYKIGARATSLLISIFIVVLIFKFYVASWYILLILISTIIFYYSLSRVMRRG